VYIDNVDLRCSRPAGGYSPTDGYVIASGTSQAAPHVSGAAALMFAQNPGASVAGVRSALLASVDQKPSLAGKVATGGRLNLARALGIEPVDAPVSSGGGPPPPPPSSSQPQTQVRRSGGTARLLQIAASSARLSTLVRKGLSARVDCTARCRLAAKLIVDRGTARKLGLASAKGDVTVATASASRSAAGVAVLKLRPKSKAGKRLARAKRVKARLEVIASVRLTELELSGEQVIAQHESDSRQTLTKGLTLRR
jgi:hypothetical protein